MGWAWRMMMNRPTARNGVTHRKMAASCGLMRKAITKEKTSITGARKSMRLRIWKAICTLVTSVVMRVTRLAVEKRSMLEKEKSCT